MGTSRHLTFAKMLAMCQGHAQVSDKSSWISDVQGRVGLRYLGSGQALEGSGQGKGQAWPT